MENKKFKSRFQMIMYFLKGCKRYFLLTVLFVVLLVLFELVNPKIIGYTVDLIIGDESAIPDFVLGIVASLGGRGYLLGHLYLLSIIVVAIAIFGALVRYLFRMANSLGAEKLVKNMHDLLYEHILHLPYSWHDINKTGDIIQRCTSDVDMIKNFISEQLVNLVRMIVMIVIAFIFMGQIHLKLTLVALIFVPIVLFYSLIFHNKIGESFAKVDVEEGKLSSIAQENLTGVRVVRAFGREFYERDRFENENEVYTGLWVYLMKILSIFWTVNDVLRGSEIITILSLGAYFTVRGDMTAGSYVAFLSLNSLVVWPLGQLGRVISELSKAGVSIDRLMYIMNSKREEDKTDAVDFPENGEIEFRDVSFSYETEDSSEIEVLKDINLKIKAGETIGILGKTGSGKSTLIQLLDGLYDIKQGQILINGVDVSNIKKSSLRQNIGMVLQEPYLFSRSLEENITLATEDATHEEVEEVVRTASLSSSIAKFKDGYKTYVGERGVTLSGGQKQRTAIAQMLITRPKIMIFDDSLSAVDAETDAKIRRALKEAKFDATIILISHRITTIMGADNIFVLEDGRIVENGNHDELVAKNGIYNRIFNMQRAAGEE